MLNSADGSCNMQICCIVLYGDAKFKRRKLHVKCVHSIRQILNPYNALKRSFDMFCFEIWSTEAVLNWIMGSVMSVVFQSRFEQGVETLRKRTIQNHAPGWVVHIDRGIVIWLPYLGTCLICVTSMIWSQIEIWLEIWRYRAYLAKCGYKWNIRRRHRHLILYTINIWD